MVALSASASSAQTALAVLTRNAAPAAAPALRQRQQPAAEREPAVVIDPRTAKLAEAAREAAERAPERDGAAAAGEGRAAARGAYTDELRRKGVEEYEKSVVQRQESLQRTKEMIRIYEETGELMNVQEDGSLGKLRPQDRLLVQGQEERYIEQLRKEVGYAAKILPEVQETAKRMRAEYESRGKA